MFVSHEHHILENENQRGKKRSLTCFDFKKGCNYGHRCVIFYWFDLIVRQNNGFICVYFVMDIETLDFKFLLKPKYNNSPCVVEEGPNRQLIGGTLQGDARLALFKLIADDILEYRVFIKADRVSPFDLAASWRAYQENLRPSAVRGIPDVSIDSVPQTGAEVCKNLHFSGW